MWTTIHFKVCRGSENEILWLFSEQITDQGEKKLKKKKIFFSLDIVSSNAIYMIIDDVLCFGQKRLAL